MEIILRVCYVARLQRAVSGGGFPGVAPQAQPQAGMWYAFSVLFCRLQQEFGKRRQTCGFRQSRSGFQPLLNPSRPPPYHATCLPAVLRACSPQRDMTPQTPPSTPVFRLCCEYQRLTAYAEIVSGHPLIIVVPAGCLWTLWTVWTASEQVLSSIVSMLRRRRLTMLNPSLQAGVANPHETVPCKGTTAEKATGTTSING
jgi:hypothetical protein